MMGDLFRFIKRYGVEHLGTSQIALQFSIEDFHEGSRGEIPRPIRRTTFGENIGVNEEVSFESRKLGVSPLDFVEVIFGSAEAHFGLVDVFVGVDVVDELHVIGVLLVPFVDHVVTEIVPQRHEDDVVGEERASSGILLQEELAFFFDIFIGDGLGFDRVLRVFALHLSEIEIEADVGMRPATMLDGVNVERLIVGQELSIRCPIWDPFKISVLL